MDMVPYSEDGRPIGEAHGRCKTKMEDIERMRDLHEYEGKTFSQILAMYPHIPRSRLSRILNYKLWATTPAKWKPRKEMIEKIQRGRNERKA